MEAVDTDLTSTAPSSKTYKMRKTLRASGWAAFAIGSLVFFTLLKLPEDRIGQIVLSTLNQQLSSGPMPLEIQADRTRLSLLPPGVRLEGIVIKARDSQGKTQRIRWSQLKVSPSLLDLTMGRAGGSVRITTADGKPASLEGSAWNKGDRFSLDLTLHDADLGEMGVGLLPMLAHVSGKLPIQGRIQLHGDFSQPSTLEGEINLVPGKVELPAQKVSGFPIPSLLIQGGEIKAKVAAGKARIESLKLGKMTESGDDLSGQMTGEVGLARSLDSSQLNLKVQLKLSEQVTKSLFLIDALLGPAKTQNGTYSFDLQGPAFAPNLVPSAGAGG